MAMSTVFAAAMLLAGPPAAPDVAVIDAALAAVYKPDAPGATVIVVRDGSVVFRKSYGMANLETRTPLTPDMAIPIGSVTKSFTAAAIMALAQDGKLQLDMPLQRFFPDYKALPTTVTLEHLLTHTSGIKSYSEMQAWFEKIRADPTTQIPPADLADMALKEPLLFAPGTSEAYSGSDYVLLALVVEKVSGQPYKEFLRARVLRPLTMDHTFCASPQTIAPVLGYRKREGGFKPEPFLGGGGCDGAGGLAATADDLGRWSAALTTDAILARSWRALMMQPATLPEGRTGSWARGWEVWDHGGRHYVWHGGYTWGFLSAVVNDVEDRVTVAIVSNNVSPLEEIDPQYLAKRITLMAAGRGGAEPSAIAPDSALLARYSGVYADAAGTKKKVLQSGQQLFTQSPGGPKYEIYPERSDRFFYKNSFIRLTFVTDKDGLITMVEDGESPAQTWKRVGDIEPRKTVRVPASTLATYVGEYEIRAGSILVVTQEGDRLFGQPTGGPKDEFLAASETDFFIESGDTEFSFAKDAAGNVTAVVLHTGDWKIEAKRIR